MEIGYIYFRKKHADGHYEGNVLHDDETFSENHLLVMEDFIRQQRAKLRQTAQTLPKIAKAADDFI